MADFKIESKTFKDPTTGVDISYNRLVCTTYAQGKLRISKFKLADDNDYTLLDLLINSDENKPSIVHTNDSTLSPKVTVTSDENQDWGDLLND